MNVTLSLALAGRVDSSAPEALLKCVRGRSESMDELTCSAVTCCSS